MSLSVETLLECLTNTPAIDLLQVYDHPEYLDFWDRDEHGPRLYSAVSRALIVQGHSYLALTLARRGLEQESFKGDPALTYNTALAYARGGNINSASQRLAPLLKVALAADAPTPANMTPRLRVGVVALRGRLFKDLYRREQDPDRRRELARQSADWYLQAASLPGADTFPLINAATMRRLAGDSAEARSLAGRCLEQVGSALLGTADADDYWRLANAGEAHLLRGEHDAALGQYVAAVDRAWKKGAVGDLVSMLGNLSLLAEAKVTAEPFWLRDRLGSVIVFSGHRIDPPQRADQGLPPCFPNNPVLVNRVKGAIRERLAKLNARFGFCSLASGSDILFAEAMLEREAELHVILPFARDDFMVRSVDYACDDAQFQSWRHRFNAVLDQLKPDSLHYATTEPYLGTDVLFGYANQFIQGMGVIRARQCLIEPIALVVLDPAADRVPGGTADFRDRWAKPNGQVETIDLAVLRGNLPAQVPAATARPTPVLNAGLPRVIRGMLFADVAGFSQMNEERAPTFFTRFPQAVAQVLASAGERVLLANTWGDGFFAVFEDVVACAGFALDLLDTVGREVAWRELGFADDNPLRVGMHAGPVFEVADDPILRRRNFFGQHVNRAVRIEPVTMTGCAFASEQFAALLTLEAPQRFQCEEIGVEILPKKAGALALYRISRG